MAPALLALLNARAGRFPPRRAPTASARRIAVF